MKYAVSLARQGELINAVDADYHSFKQHLLTCPHCGASVFLTKQHNRVAAERTLKSGRKIAVDPCEIAAFFSHHQADSIECELYNQAIGTAAVAKSVTAARNQRLKTFIERFIAIFLTAELLVMFEDLPVAEVRKAIAGIIKHQNFFNTIPATLFSATLPIPFNTRQLEPSIRHSVKFPYNSGGRTLLVDRVLPRVLAKIPREHRRGSDETQLKYAIEALDFLYKPQQWRLLTEIFWILAVETAGSVCGGMGYEIMSSAVEIGLAVDRDAKIAKLPKFLQEALLAALTDSLPEYAIETGVSSTQAKALEIRLPLTLLLTSLLTIDWGKAFGSELG